MTIVDQARNAPDTKASDREAGLDERVFTTARRVLEAGPVPDPSERAEAFEQAVDEAIGAYTFGVDTVLCGEGEVSVPLFVVDG